LKEPFGEGEFVLVMKLNGPLKRLEDFKDLVFLAARR
jgi:hypothetical protein